MLRNTSGPSSRAQKLQTEMQTEMQSSEWEPEERGHELPAFGITEGVKVDDTSQVNGHWYVIGDKDHEPVRWMDTESGAGAKDSGGRGDIWRL